MMVLERALPPPEGDRSQDLPILVGFRTELLPVLTLLWTGITVAFVVTNEAR